MGQSLNLCVNSCMNKEESRTELVITQASPPEYVEVVPLIKVQGLQSAPNEVFQDLEGFSMLSVQERLREARGKFMGLLMTEEGMELKVNKSNVNVWTKETPEGFVLKTVWRVPYSLDVYMDYLKDFSQKVKWDDNLEEAKLICNLSSDVSITYQRYKRVIPISPRDFVIASQLERLPGAILDLSTSVESVMYPVDPAIVRARLLFGGYFVESMQRDEDSNITKVISISETDFGGNLPKNMVKTMAALKMSSYVTSIDRELKKFLSKA
jgi:hypothetical protein